MICTIEKDGFVKVEFTFKKERPEVIIGKLSDGGRKEIKFQLSPPNGRLQYTYVFGSGGWLYDADLKVGDYAPAFIKGKRFVFIPNSSSKGNMSVETSGDMSGYIREMDGTAKVIVKEKRPWSRLWGVKK